MKTEGPVHAVEGRLQSPIAAATAAVGVSADKARQWFVELEKHPERYRFETHAGFRFTRGNFGEVGARFETRERFRGLRLSLMFELLEVGEAFFRFRLMRPGVPVWGRFVIEETLGGTAELRLDVGGTTRLGACFLQLPPIKAAVQEQIRREVAHIQASMEASYHDSAGEHSLERHKPLA